MTRIRTEKIGSGMALMELMLGLSVEVVGIDDEPDGALRVYLTHGANRIYTIVEAGETAEKIRAEWRDVSCRLLIPRPSDSAISQDAEVEP